MISYVLWYHSTKHDIIFQYMISHSFSDIINTNNDIICWCHNVISYVTSYVIQQQTFSFGCRCTLSACRLPAAFFCLFSPSPCLADSILPGSLCLVDGHRPGLASSVAPQPEIHLVQSAAVPAIRLGIGGCRSQVSAVLELVGNSRMGVAVYEAGNQGGSQQYICRWAYV